MRILSPKQLKNFLKINEVNAVKIINSPGI